MDLPFPRKDECSMPCLVPLSCCYLSGADTQTYSSIELDSSLAAVHCNSVSHAGCFSVHIFIHSCIRGRMTLYHTVKRHNAGHIFWDIIPKKHFSTTHFCYGGATKSCGPVGLPETAVLEDAPEVSSSFHLIQETHRKEVERGRGGWKKAAKMYWVIDYST